MRNYNYFIRRWCFQLLALSLVALAVSCDDFNEDIVATPDQRTSPDAKRIKTTFDAPVVINLEDNLNSDDISGLRTSLAPAYGSLEITQNGIVTYQKNESTEAPKSDQFAIDFMNIQSDIVFTDTIIIEFVSDTSGIPCFNGALSDFMKVSKNATLNFNVLWNDGYCADQVKVTKVEIVEQPQQGTINNAAALDNNTNGFLGEGTFSYTPNKDFVGKDKFLYKLVLTDQNGETFQSYAYVYITIFSIDESCVLMAKDDDYHFSPLTLDIKTFNPLDNDQLCEGYTLVMGQPVLGKVEKLDNKGNYRYIPTSLDCTQEPCGYVDSILYELRGASGQNSTAFITVKVGTIDTMVYCLALPSAEDDYFSITPSDQDTLILDVLTNDFWCANDRDMSIVNAFDDFRGSNYGYPFLIDNKTIGYVIYNKNIAFKEVFEYSLAQNGFVVSSAVVTIDNQGTKEDSVFASDVVSLSYGTSFGECNTNCYHEIQIDQWGVLTSISDINPAIDSTDVMRCFMSYDVNQLTQLLVSLDYQAFTSLEDILGCPDCTDGGAEWLSITLSNGHQKKVTFEYFQEPDVLKDIIAMLRVVTADHVCQ